jgi:hypothetical protein
LHLDASRGGDTVGFGLVSKREDRGEYVDTLGWRVLPLLHSGSLQSSFLKELRKSERRSLDAKLGAEMRKGRVCGRGMEIPKCADFLVLRAKDCMDFCIR